jgi:hypothetical protein
MEEIPHDRWPCAYHAGARSFLITRAATVTSIFFCLQRQYTGNARRRFIVGDLATDYSGAICHCWVRIRMVPSSSCLGLCYLYL